MIYYIDHVIQILFPPGCNILIGLIGLLLWRNKPTLGKVLVVFSFVSLWLISTPLVAQYLVDKLQYRTPTLSLEKISDNKNTSAIVVLEAGLNTLTPEYGEPTVSDTTLTRIRYAAFLYHKTGIPILVSGNDPMQPTINQANYMAKALHNYFDVPTRWKEDRGVNTAQEGLLVTEMLKKDGVTTIYLVTHAMHMPRAMFAFKSKAFTIIPAPTGYYAISNTLGIFSLLLPSTEALRLSTSAFHEYIGIMWYLIHYRS